MPIDLATIRERWLSADPPLATIDADGSLLMSSDTDRVDELFQPEEGSYEARQQGGRQVLIFTARDGTQISAWLEANEKNPRRPLARFAYSP